MQHSLLEKLALTTLKGKAFGKFYPRYTVLTSIFTSLIGGGLVGTTLLLWLGPANGVMGPNWIEQIHSVVALASFSGGLALVSALVGWSFFGRQVSDYLTQEYPAVTNPVFYLASSGVLVVAMVALYYIVTLLNGLSEILGFAVVALALLYRVSSSNVWVSMTGSAEANKWISRTCFAAPFVGIGGAWMLGALPSVPQGTTLALYALALWLTTVGPVDAVFNHIDDALQLMGAATEGRRLLVKKKDRVEEQAPATVDVDVEIPAPVSTPAEATAMLDTIETVEPWLDTYDAYVNARLALTNHLPRDVRQQALSSDGSLETRVATIAENLRPSHYDEATDAAEAAQTLTQLVERYTHDHLPSDFMADADLLQVAGPDENERAAIEDGLDPLPA